MGLWLKRVFVYPIPTIISIVLLLYFGMVLEDRNFEWEYVELTLAGATLAFTVIHYSTYAAGIGTVARGTDAPFERLARKTTYRVVARSLGRDKTQVVIVEDLDQTNNWTLRIPRDLILPEYFKITGWRKAAMPIYDRVASADLTQYDFEQPREVTYPTKLYG